MTERELSLFVHWEKNFPQCWRIYSAHLRKIAAQAQTFEEKLASQSVVLQKCVTGDDVRPMLEQMVKEAVSHIPVPATVVTTIGCSAEGGE